MEYSENGAADFQLLSSIYYNLGGPAAFSNSETLLQEARRHNPQISRKTIDRFLDKSYVYQKHKPIHWRKYKDKTLPVVTSGPRQLFDCDLAFMPGSRFVGGLLCVDTFSSKLFFQPILSKQSKAIGSALQKLIDTQSEQRWPASVRMDKVSHYCTVLYHTVLNLSIAGWRIPWFFCTNFEKQRSKAYFGRKLSEG